MRYVLAISCALVVVLMIIAYLMVGASPG